MDQSYDVVTFCSGGSKSSRSPVTFSRVVQRPVSNTWLEPVAVESYRALYEKPNIYDSYYHNIYEAYGTSTPTNVASIRRRQLRRYRRRHRTQFDREEDYEDSDSDED